MALPGWYGGGTQGHLSKQREAISFLVVGRGFCCLSLESPGNGLNVRVLETYAHELEYFFPFLKSKIYAF